MEPVMKGHQGHQVLSCNRDQALYRAIVVYGDLAQYDDIEAKTGHVWRMITFEIHDRFLILFF